VAREAVAHHEPLGPLHGVPLSIKDSFDIAGQPTLCGSRLRLGHRAVHDAACVTRFRRAGAIILGKTNTPEFLANWETDNNLTGRTNNPWDVTRTPGGSSGGESAAIASFCSAGGIGSDGGGSIRIPAAFTGIAGLKPTPGRVSAAGHYPEIAHPGGLLGVAGPMARDAASLKVLFEVLAGYDRNDPFSAPVPLRPADLAGIRVGVMEQWPGVGVQPEVVEPVRRAAAILNQIGIPAEPFTPYGMKRVNDIWHFFFVELTASFTRDMIAGREGDCHWSGTELLHRTDGQPALTARDVVLNLAIRDKLRGSLLRQMEQFPVLLLPACGVPAFRHRERSWPVPEGEIEYLQAMAPVTPFNLFGMPGLVIPFGLTAQGLPVGIQLVASPWCEELLIELALRLEEARGPFPLRTGTGT
ncbi:MAG: amidase family protein, partial [Bryobacteraceae bacterium]